MPTNSSQPKSALRRRPPVVVVMGHIDHGKSTLLDYIRKANVVAGEAGGITQHVGAYQAEHTSADGVVHPITFLDTPGHAAFSSIRERGALAADVAILVVSAEDGVKPQTMEAYREIAAAKIPYVVAINKIDKPNADIDRAKTTLAENEIYVEGWGGDVPCVPVSALKGTGVSELLDMVLLVAELADLAADPAAPASGIVVESELDTRKGISATLLIKNGSLETGTFIVAGAAFTPVRYIEDFRGKKIPSASASTPVVIIGWSEIPACGSTFSVVASKKEAERIVSAAKEAARSAKNAATVNVPAPARAADKRVLGPDGADMAAPQTIVIPLIIKADVIGSLDGVKHELAKISHDKVKLKIVAEGIGAINENDVKMAASDPHIVVVGFNAQPESKAAAIIERSATPMNVKSFDIIYELAQYVQELLDAKIPKEYVEEVTGHAKILGVFSKEKDRQVVGGKVQTGFLERGNDVRILRREAEIGRGKIRELQQQKKRVDEVREGFEFGTLIEAKVEIAVGDHIEAVRTVEKK